MSSAKVAAKAPTAREWALRRAGIEIVMTLSLEVDGSAGPGGRRVDYSPNNRGIAMADWRTAFNVRVTGRH
jgi:hypothetical protein